MKKFLLLFLLLTSFSAFAQKAVVAKNWSMVVCADSKYHSSNTDGSCSFSKITGAKILYTDITAGPTTGGENNKGAYLSIYGVNLAANFAALGNSTIVYVCGQPVDNYRVYKPAVGTGISGLGNGVFETFGTMRLTVQLGALGSPTAGVACPIDIKTNGTSTPINTKDGSGFYLDDDGNQISFTPQPGPIVFVDQAGNDANSGTIASPLRHLQVYTVGNNPAFTGAVYGAYPNATTQSNVAQPGTHYIVRGGTWTDCNDLSSFNRWVSIWRITGTAPNGASGTNPVVVNAVSVTGTASGTSSRVRLTLSSAANFNFPAGSGPVTVAGVGGTTEANGTWTANYIDATHIDLVGTTFVHAWTSGGTAGVQVQAAGPIVFTSYPGPAGGNAPESVIWAGASTCGGGFAGNDTTRAEEQTPWGFNGYGKYIQISNMKIAPNANTSNADSAPINIESVGDYWRAVNNELTWPSTIVALAGGIAGDGTGDQYFGNYIHDVYASSGLQNHCIYMDGSTGSQNHAATNTTIAYNICKNILGGNGIQSFNGKNALTMTGINVHHNWIQDVGKHGINISSFTASGKWWNNIVIRPAGMCVQLQQVSTTSANDVKIVNNTFYGWASVYPCVDGVDSLGTGSVQFMNNAEYQVLGTANSGYSFQAINSGTFTNSNNFYYDPNGVLVAAPSGTAQTYADPKFTSISSLDFTPNGLSTLPNSGAAPLFTIGDDFEFVSRPQGSNTNPAVGALERIGG
jgi:hypothetical protein